MVNRNAGLHEYIFTNRNEDFIHTQSNEFTLLFALPTYHRTTQLHPYTIYIPTTQIQ